MSLWAVMLAYNLYANPRGHLLCQRYCGFIVAVVAALCNIELSSDKRLRKI